MKSEAKIYLDIGTSKTKYIARINDNLEFFTINNEFKPNQIIENLKQEYKDSPIYVTGSGASTVKSFDDVFKFNELDCAGNLIKYHNYPKGLVVSVGTGTSFVQYENNLCTHLIGTGLGGGTISGLSKRLLNIYDMDKLDLLAMGGDLTKINKVIKDIDYGGESWFEDDVTVANFSKSGNDKSDIAAGIYSLAVEPIMSILVSLNMFKKFEKIIFCGSVINSIFFKQLILKYSKLFKIDVHLAEKPEFGTCFGLIAASE